MESGLSRSFLEHTIEERKKSTLSKGFKYEPSGVSNLLGIGVVKS